MEDVASSNNTASVRLLLAWMAPATVRIAFVDRRFRAPDRARRTTSPILLEADVKAVGERGPGSAPLADVERVLLRGEMVGATAG
jgi:DNA-binding IclR family transcriptional regulator